MDLKTFEKKLLKDPEFKKEYEKYDLAFEISQMLIEARIIKGLTQAKLAAMVNTKQSGIARAENGKNLPSITFLKRIAHGLHTRLIIRFGFMEEGNIKTTSKSTTTPQKSLVFAGYNNPAADTIRLTYNAGSFDYLYIGRN